jgi:hypothetical protein
MSNTVMISKLRALSPRRKQNALEYVDSLLEDQRKKRKRRKPLKAGFLKGTFKMSKDFDAPLEDSKEYT